jgi:hypothetical protein
MNDTFGHLDVLAQARHQRALFLADALGNFVAYVARLFKGHDKGLPRHGKTA